MQTVKELRDALLANGWRLSGTDRFDRIQLNQRRYDIWAGNPVGTAERFDRCAAQIPRNHHMIQCSNKRVKGEFCKRHADGKRVPPEPCAVYYRVVIGDASDVCLYLSLDGATFYLFARVHVNAISRVTPQGVIKRRKG